MCKSDISSREIRFDLISEEECQHFLNDHVIVKTIHMSTSKFEGV